MKGALLRALAALVACLPLACGKPEPLKPEPLRSFAEYERLFVRGGLIIAAIVALWFALVWIRGVLRERRLHRQRQDPARRPEAASPPTELKRSGASRSLPAAWERVESGLEGSTDVAATCGKTRQTMKEWRARAPVRFCDLGGWTDTRIVPHGAVLNFAARLYTYVTLRVQEGAGGVTLESLDTDERCSFQDIRRVEYNGILDLLKAAVARSGIELRQGGLYSTRREVTVQVRSDAPPASGLGSSAALGVAAIGALSAYHRRQMLPHEVARESQLLEVRDLQLECGVQDQLCSAYGGVSFMEVEYPNARVFPLPLSLSARCELEDRFVLVYTGKSHFSSAMHQKVISEAAQHQDNFDQLRRAAVAGKEALLAGDLEAFAAAMNQNWEAQKGLHPDITTPEIEALHRAAFAAGALGFKANGAGGGGTVTLLVKRNHNTRVRRAAEDLGMLVLPSQIDTTGLQVWEVEA